MPAPKNPATRVARATRAAHISWARTPDRASRTAAAREARWQQYLAKARELQGPEATPEAVERAAEHLRQADLAGMSLKAAKARSARKGGGPDGQAA